MRQGEREGAPGTQLLVTPRGGKARQMEASDLLAREKKLRRDSSQGEPTGGDGKFRAAAKTPNRDLCKEVETEAGKALETSRISPLASFLIAG